jgi:menaquinone-dependent protoporphyrinogen oxidase
MVRVAVRYGTTEGQTEAIAERMATVVTRAGHDATLRDVRALPATVSFDDVDAVVVGASVHAGSHQRYVRRFVTDNAAELNRLPSAFFSVSLTAAGGSDADRGTARSLLEAFLEGTGWEPDATTVVAGALKYSEYGPVTRFVLKRIAGRAGGDTDTSRDYEYTDWAAVEAFAADFVDRLA